MATRKVYRDRQRVFLAVWALAVLALFSISVNKLPGYILPLLPAAAALMALALDEAADARPWLVACAVLLVAFPITAQVLPAAVRSGLSHAPAPAFQPVWLAALAVALLAWLLEARGKRVAAVLAVAAGAAFGTACLKTVVTPELDRGVSARGLWREIGRQRGRGLHRARQTRLGIRAELLLRRAAALVRETAGAAPGAACPRGARLFGQGSLVRKQLRRRHG